MSTDPTIVQPLPTGNADSTDVGTAVIEYLTTRALDPENTTQSHRPLYLPEIAKDHESRISFGEKKYGQRLKINNGRNAIMDSYQELLDFLSYAMQAHLEGKEGFLDFFYTVAEIAANVRTALEEGAKPTVMFVPNQKAPETKEDIFNRWATQNQKDPESVIAIPFSELEGEFEQVDSNLTVSDLEGNRTPVKSDTAFSVAIKSVVFEPESIDPVGEEVAKELDTFDLKEEVIQPGVTFTIGDNEEGVTTYINSEEDIVKHENFATGQTND